MQVAKNVSNQNYWNGTGDISLSRSTGTMKLKFENPRCLFFLCIIYLNVNSALLEVGFPEE